VKALERPEFQSLFHEQRGPLFRFLCRLTRNAADAEDLLQETFLTAWRKRDQYRGNGSAAGFLRRTAYRLFLNARQLQRRREDLAPRAPAPVEAGAVGAEDESRERRDTLGFLSARVEEALRELPEPNRTAFVLFRYEGLTCAQVAEAMEAPLRTTETRLQRATRMLAERLRPFRDHVSHL
jgi:RNA polymerase sigma-70 factor (ECF subfamily)